MNVLGIYGGVTTMQHDAAATIMVDGKVIACVEEERLSRIKHAYGQVPVNAIAQVLKIAGLDINEIDLACHVEKNIRTFRSALNTIWNTNLVCVRSCGCLTTKTRISLLHSICRILMRRWLSILMELMNEKANTTVH